MTITFGGATISGGVTIIGSTSAASYYMGLLSSSNVVYGQGAAIDSSGNTYITGWTDIGSSNYELVLAKYNSSGTIQWQRQLGSAGTQTGQAVAVDSSGNVYVVGEPGTIVKYNSSGTIQWQVNLAITNLYSVAVDASGNIYTTGYGTVSATQAFVIAKYNTSGTIQWQRTLNSAGTDTGYGVTLDSAGHVYVVGRTIDSGNINYDAVVVQYDTNGNIQWQRSLGTAGSSDETAVGVAVDSSNNAYIAGSTNTAGTYNIFLAKYNSSGTIQWQRTLGGASFTETGKGVSVDGSGNIYVLGQATGSTYDFIIAKYDSTGAILWQRTLTTAGQDYSNSISVNSAGDICVTGYTFATPNTSALFAKLPSDGSLTGTYTVNGYSLTYTTGSFTDAAGTLTSSTSSLTDASSVYSSTTTSLTDSAGSLTSNVTTIG